MANESEELVRMQVDANKCIGSGACEMLEEETFLVDDDTSIASVIGTGLLTPAQAEAVIEKCPTQAISLEVVDVTEKQSFDNWIDGAFVAPPRWCPDGYHQPL